MAIPEGKQNIYGDDSLVRLVWSRQAETMKIMGYKGMPDFDDRGGMEERTHYKQAWLTRMRGVTQKLYDMSPPLG